MRRIAHLAPACPGFALLSSDVVPLFPLFGTVVSNRCPQDMLRRNRRRRSRGPSGRLQQREQWSDDISEEVAIRVRPCENADAQNGAEEKEGQGGSGLLGPDRPV
jgi:hypothetical protein